MKSNTFADFSLSHDADVTHATGHGLAVTVEGGRMFHRRCIKHDLNGVSPDTRDSILVAELDGVRIYVKPPGHIIITKRDLKL